LADVTPTQQATFNAKQNMIMHLMRPFRNTHDVLCMLSCACAANADSAAAATAAAAAVVACTAQRRSENPKSYK
jgi:hypothetical protein